MVRVYPKGLRMYILQEYEATDDVRLPFKLDRRYECCNVKMGMERSKYEAIS